MMPGDALLLVLVLIFGCAAFFFGVIYLVFRSLGWLGRGFVGAFRSVPPEAPNRPAGDRRPRLGCPRTECGRIEDREGAHYCSQCGAGLRPIPRVDQNDQ